MEQEIDRVVANWVRSANEVVQPEGELGQGARLQEPTGTLRAGQHCVVVKMEAATQAVPECDQSGRGQREISAQASW